MKDEASSISKGGALGFVVLGVILGSTVSGLVTTVIVFLGEDLITYISELSQQKIEDLQDGFASENESSMSATLVFFPFVSLLCLVFGSIFLGTNRQSGVSKYASGAIIGALCLSLPAILFSLGEAMELLLPFVVSSLIAGALGATSFLGVVHIFDFDGRFFKLSEK